MMRGTAFTPAPVIGAAGYNAGSSPLQLMENIGLATVPAEQKPYVGRFIKQAQIRAAPAAKPKDDRLIFMLNL